MKATIKVYRQPAIVRLTHWLVALALLVLTMSGLQIFNAHPSLYAADQSTFGAPVLDIGAREASNGQVRGYTRIGGLDFDTTGVLGYTDDGTGGSEARAFPAWATIPYYRDLADGRRWHIFFAWVFGLCALAYAAYAIRLIPRGADLRALPAALRDHLLPWRVHASAEYNPMQKLAYFSLVFVIAPLAVLSGLALSPAVDAWAPWLPAMFGGRQFARIWHFGAMLAIIGFFVVHVVMVVVTGFWNNLRSMITGWLAVEGAAK